MVYELLDTEGLYLGASSALNVVAAVELALKLGKGEGCLALCALPDTDDRCRIQGCDDAMRWRLPVSKPTVFETMARDQGAGERDPRASEEICCIRLKIDSEHWYCSLGRRITHQWKPFEVASRAVRSNEKRLL